MPTLGAIDIGSNAMRLAVGFVDAQRRLQVVEDLREPVRLGQDVFTRGVITRPTLEKALKALQIFKGCWTTPGDSLSGGGHQRPSGSPQPRRCIAPFPAGGRFGGKNHHRRGGGPSRPDGSGGPHQPEGPDGLVGGRGGGSVEVTLVKDGRIAATESFNMGAVRLLKMLEGEKADERKFNRLVEEYTEAARRRILEKFGGKPVNLCVGTGGTSTNWVPFGKRSWGDRTAIPSAGKTSPDHRTVETHAL